MFLTDLRSMRVTMLKTKPALYAIALWQVIVLSAKLSPCQILWSADMETGDLRQWYSSKGKDKGGGEFDSGDATAAASQDYAHSGKWSLKLTITAPPSKGGHSSGGRMFRWEEAADPAYFSSGLYYGAWFYFPQAFRLSADPRTGGFWSILQFKSKHPAGNDPIWYLDIQNQPDRPMYATLYWWNRLAMEGPREKESGGRRFTQAATNLPVGKWVHIEVYLKQASDFTGRLTVWQDGMQIFDESNVKTRYADGDNQWSVNNYSDGLQPAPSTIYIDDATISTSRVGP